MTQTVSSSFKNSRGSHLEKKEVAKQADTWNRLLKAPNLSEMRLWCYGTPYMYTCGAKRLSYLEVLKPKKLVQFKTINHFSAQDWEQVEKEKENYVWQKGRCLIYLCINSLNTHIVAVHSLFSINIHWIEFQRPNILKSSLHTLMCQWRRVAVGLWWEKSGTLWDAQLAKLDHSKT